MARKTAIEIRRIKEAFLTKIRNLNMKITRNSSLGNSFYLVNEEIYIDIAYASLNSRNEYFFGIEKEQFNNVFEKNKNFYQIFICDDENQVFIIHASLLDIILKDDKSTTHDGYQQWKPIIRQKDDIFIMRFFGTYEINEHLNNFNYFKNNVVKKENLNNNDMKSENFIKNILEKDISVLKQNGLKIVKNHHNHESEVDLLCKDENGYITLIIKKNKVEDEVVGQLLRSMGWVRENLSPTQLVRGLVIVAYEGVTEKLRKAVKGIQRDDNLVRILSIDINASNEIKVVENE